MVYGTRGDEKRQEVILVFEEKLLINTVGKILGIKTNKLDAMLVNAARYTARQFRCSHVLIFSPVMAWSSVRVWPTSHPAHTPRKCSID